jgi:hypothetical protein
MEEWMSSREYLSAEHSIAEETQMMCPFLLRRSTKKHTSMVAYIYAKRYGTLTRSEKSLITCT